MIRWACMYLHFSRFLLIMVDKFNHIEITIVLPQLLISFFSNKRWRCKYKAQLINIFQLLPEFLKGVDRETCGGNRHTTARFDRHHQIVTQGLINIINELSLHYGVTCLIATDSIMAN